MGNWLINVVYFRQIFNESGCKHPSPDSYRDALRVTVRLSVVPA
jgi:hypothetical protein